MRSLRLAALLALMLAPAGIACSSGENERPVPDVPVQGGEALQVEVNPASPTVGNDTATVGTPGVTRPSRDSL